MSRMVSAAAVALAVAAPYLVWNPYHLHTLIMAGIFAVLALSLNLLYRGGQNGEEGQEGGRAENGRSVNQALYPVYAPSRFLSLGFLDAG